MLTSLANNKIIPKVLIVTMLYLSGLSTANAVMISGADLVTEQQVQKDKNRLLQSLEREEVRSALIAQGVDPVAAKQRVLAMTAEEVNLMNQKMDELPAGAGVLEVALIVFLVLLFTDIMGYTDIFPFVKKTAK
jgi:hypothetical protein